MHKWSISRDSQIFEFVLGAAGPRDVVFTLVDEKRRPLGSLSATAYVMVKEPPHQEPSTSLLLLGKHVIPITKKGRTLAVVLTTPKGRPLIEALVGPPIDVAPSEVMTVPAGELLVFTGGITMADIRGDAPKRRAPRPKKPADKRASGRSKRAKR